MASALARAKRPAAAAALAAMAVRRAFASVAVGSDIVSAAPGVALQKARSWDEGVSSKFATTPLTEIFQGKKVVIFGLPGAYTGVCSAQHVPSYTNNIDKFKAKGVDSVICVAVNDPYVLNGWAEKLQAKEAAVSHLSLALSNNGLAVFAVKLNNVKTDYKKVEGMIEFYGDFDGSFHKSLELDLDLSAALLGRRSHRWSAYVVDGKVKVFNIEKVPSEFKVSGAEVILGQI